MAVMSDVAAQALIDSLAGKLRPVRRLAPPWLRTALWCAAVLALGAAALTVFTPKVGLHLLMRTPDMALGAAGAALTCVLAAAAAFITSVPGRSGWWAALPLPALALWLSASTAGCLRLAPAAGMVPELPGHAMDCLLFIVVAAVPLASLLMWLILRACPLRPALTAALAGLASAAAAAVILIPLHPFDATATDLLAHLAAVIVVIALVQVAGRRA